MSGIHANTLYMTTQDGYRFFIVNFEKIKRFIAKQYAKKLIKDKSFSKEEIEKVSKGGIENVLNIEECFKQNEWWTSNTPDIHNMMSYYGIKVNDVQIEFLNESIVYYVFPKYGEIIMVQCRKISGNYYNLRSFAHKSRIIGNSQSEGTLDQYKKSDFYNVVDIRTSRTKNQEYDYFNWKDWLLWEKIETPEQVIEVDGGWKSNPILEDEVKYLKKGKIIKISISNKDVEKKNDLPFYQGHLDENSRNLSKGELKSGDTIIVRSFHKNSNWFKILEYSIQKIEKSS